MKKDIIVMAKSSKRGNYCIAGIDINNGEWIRPISDNKAIEGAVPVEDCTYKDNTEVQPLDVVRIDLVDHFPSNVQSENYLYNDANYWEKVSEEPLKNVINQYLDSPDYIFCNNRHYLYECELNGNSLLFVEILQPQINVHAYPERIRVTISFFYNNHHYKDISIGIKALKDEYKRYGNGDYDLGDRRFAVFSLTGKHSDGRYYKMLAHLF